MKKLCLLSGMIAFGVVVNVNAMEKERPAAYRMIDELVRKTKKSHNLMIDWGTIFHILDSNQDVINAHEYFEPKYEYTLLQLAVIKGDLSAAKTLLEKYKVDPNVLSGQYNKQNALMLACSAGNFEMVKLLLMHGANPYLNNSRGSNAFAYANRHPEVMKLLKSYTRSAAAA